MAAFTTTITTSLSSLLWMLLFLVFPSVATAAQCMFIDGPGFPVIDGNTITCDDDECRGGTIKGCDNVICEEPNSCFRTTISGAKKVQCTDSESCDGSAIQQIQDGGQIVCDSPFACLRANIGTDQDSGKFDVLCSGRQACGGASIITSGLVVCENGDQGVAACGNSVEIEAACLVCNGDFSCDSTGTSKCSFTEFGSTNTEPCPADGEATCDEDEQICLSATQDISNCQVRDELQNDVDMLKDTIMNVNDQVLNELSPIKGHFTSLEVDVLQLNATLEIIRNLLEPVDDSGKGGKRKK